jgi:chromosome segregation ATPase
MTLEELTQEVVELRRRLNIAETKLSQQAGQFEFITGQLRDMQLYMHARFEDMDKRFDRLEADMSTMKADMTEVKVQLAALPRVIAEMIAKR